MKSTLTDIRIQGDFASLPLTSKQLSVAEEVKYRTRRYVARENLHVTLIGSGHRFVPRFAEAKGFSIEEAAKMAPELYSLAANGLRFFVALKPRFYEVVKLYREPRDHIRRSLIVECQVNAAVEFYDRLARVTGVKISPVPHHVTLFTDASELSRQGIGLSTPADMTQYARQITDPNFLKLMPSF